MRSLFLFFLLAVPCPLVELGLTDVQALSQLVDRVLGPVRVFLPGLFEDIVLDPGQPSSPLDVFFFLCRRGLRKFALFEPFLLQFSGYLFLA